MATALLCFAGAGGAACLVSSDARFTEFERLMLTRPADAEAWAKARLRSPDANQLAYRAELYTALAEAYAMQEKHEETRRAVTQGLMLARDEKSPTYLNLLYLDAQSPSSESEIAISRKRAEDLVKQQPADSQAQACVLLTLGLIELFADRPDQASIHLTRVYRMSMTAEREHQRMIAATILSMVMQSLRDFKAALALSQETIDWHTRRGAESELSTAYFMRGYILTELRDSAAALEALAHSRALSAKMQDPIGMAYSDLLICTNDIALGRLRDARSLCAQALDVFDAAHVDDPAKQSWLALAEIDLAERKTTAALQKLNLVLSQNGRDLVPLRVAHAFELRSRAHRDLGHYQAALADFDTYMQRFKANKEDERAREASAMRARFETDREIERNDFLHRELQSKNEKLAAQAERLQWMIIAAVMGVGGVLMLTLLLIANRKKKKLLARLAQEDELTGLANRRYTLRRANLAFEAVRKHDAPLTIGILDLDHFKRINDQFGHAAGDHVLREFARIARDSVRKTDLLGRWGGEEFLLVMPNTELDVALIALDRIRQAAASIHGGPLPADYTITVSAGIAHDDGRAEDLEDLIAEADGALYEAKANGRNRVQVAQESFDASATSIRRRLRSSGVDLTTGKFAAAR